MKRFFVCFFLLIYKCVNNCFFLEILPSPGTFFPINVQCLYDTKYFMGGKNWLENELLITF